MQKVVEEHKNEIISSWKNTSPVEIQNISKNGIWIFVNEREYFLPYKEYPWFKDAKVSEIHNLKYLMDHI